MHQMQKVVRALCARVGTPRALAVKLLCDAGEWTELQKLRMRSPESYPDADSYFKDALVTELLRKCDLPTDVDKGKVARESFRSSEHRCFRTNRRLIRFLHNFDLSTEDEPVVRFISEWRKEIRRVFVAVPSTLVPRFSGGATYADVGMLKTIPDKMSSTPTTYEGLAGVLQNSFWGTQWGRLCESRAPRDVRGNIFFTVPKDGSKFRGCAKEASVPVSLQLDAARHLRRVLKRLHIDLSSGKEVHMDLAREGSLTGEIATLDMSNASDTVCRVLVELLLPQEWFELLDSLRAKRTRVDGKWVLLEKFSSMGNGFTFELETLIFATLARTVIRLTGDDPEVVRCFGDDLIVPSRHAASVLAALEYFGFEPNTRKSYWVGPFRESCGGDYFNGVPVRAHYVEKLPDEPQHWIALANGLRRVDPSMRYVKPAWDEAVSMVPSAIRQCRGPVSLGDLVIHDRESDWCLRVTPREGGLEDLHEVRVYRPIPIVLNWHHWKPNVVLSSATLGMPSQGVTPRGGVSGYKRDWAELPGSRWLPSPGRG